MSSIRVDDCVCVCVCVCVYHANVSVDVEDAFVGALLVQFGQNKLLHPKNNTILTADRYGCAAHTYTHTELDTVCHSSAFRCNQTV